MKKKYYMAPSCEIDYFKTESSVLTTSDSENDNTVIDPFNPENQSLYNEF